MKQQRETISAYLFHSILLMLFLPILQLFFCFQTKPLSGVSILTTNPSWSWSDWTEGKYQMRKDSFWKENFGFRADAIRLNNERIYLSYNASSNEQILIGKDNCLFERVYIKEYCGLDYIGRENIIDYVSKLKIIQDRLKLLGKTFVVVIAPSKARYYSELLPNGLVEGDTTNYSAYLEEIKKYGLEVLDFNAYFKGIKDTVAYPLFPQTGTHWSDYGVTYFVDSLMKHLDVAMGKDVPDMIWDEIKVSDRTLYIDRDIEDLLNLVSPIRTKPHAYTKIKYKMEGKYKPSVLAIGDSFYGTFYYYKDTVQNVFSSSSYWYYYSQMHPENRKREKKDLADALNKKDLIILLGTTAGLNGLGWGAVNDLYNYVQKTGPDIIQAIKQEIINAPAWYSSIVEKAKNRNISVDSMLYLDAVYIMEERRNS